MVNSGIEEKKKGSTGDLETKTMISRSLMLKLVAGSFVFFSIQGCFIGFASAYALNAKQYSAQIVGYILAAYCFSAFVGQLFWTALCDRIRTNKKVFVFGMFLSLLLFFLVYFSASPLMFILCYGCLGFIFPPMRSIFESWTLKVLNDNAGLYGRVRSFGALGYGFGMLIVGFVINSLGYIAMLVSAVFWAVAMIALVFSIPDAHYTKQGGGMKLKDVSVIIKNPVIVMLMLIMLLIGLTNTPIGNFKILVMERIGGSTDFLGIESMIGCIAQFFMYLAADYFSRFSARKLMLSVTAGFLLGAVIYEFAGSFAAVLFGCLFMYGFYAPMQTGMMTIVSEYVEPDLQTTGIGLVDICYSAIAGIMAMLFYGKIVDIKGINFMIMLCIITGVLSVILSTVLVFMKKKTK